MDAPAKHFGWKRQLPDLRDKKFCELDGMMLVAAPALPEVVDLRPKCPPVYDQGALGSCTANAIGFICHYEMHNDQNLKEDFAPSRLFIYFNERWMENSIQSDAGAALRDGIKSLNVWGFPPETKWPYQIEKFKIRPSADVYKIAAKKKVKVKDYGAVEQDLTAIKTALASGYPIVIGIVAYESLVSKAVQVSGVLPMPKPGERVIGGHAIAIVGYDKDGWICRNSWGENWGMKGYFKIPYEYLTNENLAMDLWVVRFIV